MIGVQTQINELGARFRLGRLEERIGDVSKPLKECGLVMMRSVARNFKAGGRPVPWKKSKRAEAAGGKTLIDTARLKNSITMKVDGGSLRVGTSVKYARIHQLGGEINKSVTVGEHWRLMTRAFGKPIPARSVMVKAHTRKMDVTMPARPFLLIQKQDRKIFNRIIGDYLAQ